MNWTVLQDKKRTKKQNEGRSFCNDNGMFLKCHENAEKSQLENGCGENPSKKKMKLKFCFAAENDVRNYIVFKIKKF